MLLHVLPSLSEAVDTFQITTPMPNLPCLSHNLPFTVHWT